jgi:hypothetical protein
MTNIYRIDSTTQLLALQLDVSLNAQCSRSQRIILQADSKVCMAYLESIGQNWSIGERYTKALEPVLRQLELPSQEDTREVDQFID